MVCNVQDRIDELKGLVVDALRGVSDVKLKRIFLFGSRARKDNGNPHADIDIGIVADSPLTHRDMAMLRDAVDAVDTLYKMDLVDFTERSDSFTEEALRSIEVLYEEKS